jgi:ssRNA-specific RNase YbeY (16S rRNA maturation enzyme)
MTEIILLAIFILHLISYNDIKNYIEEQRIKEKQKESILRKGLM